MGNAFQKIVCISVAATIALAGCGTQGIRAKDVSPTIYADADCEQLHAEVQRIQPRYVELEAQLEEDLSVSGTLAISIFWFALWQDAMERLQEFQRLKGERQAILKAAAEKRCPWMEQQLTTDKADTAQSKASDEQATVPATPK
jgi:hypothetical protein